MARIFKPYDFSGSGALSNHRFNRNYQRIYDELNGNIDDSNIKAGANIDAGGISTSAKISNVSIPGSKLVGNVLGDASFDYTDALVVRCGPNITNHGLRMARGAKDWTITTAQINTVLFVVFAVDSEDGNPNFETSVGLRITLGIQIDSGDFTYSLLPRIESVYATGFLVDVQSSVIAGPASDTSGKLLWQAMGDV